jgi:hypothetical protein
MSPRTESNHPVDLPRELAHRSDDGIEVVLLWNQSDDRLTLVVADTRRAESFEVGLDDTESPLDAFYHPFAYVASRRSSRRRAADDLWVRLRREGRRSPL